MTSLDFLVHTPRGACHDVPARPRPGRRQDLLQRPAGQLLPARDRTPGAVPGRRHRPGAVPVDAAQDRAGRQRAPSHLIFGVTNDADLVEVEKLGAGPPSAGTSPATVVARTRPAPQRQGLCDPPHAARAPERRRFRRSTCAGRRRWWTRCASTWPTRASSRPASTTRSSRSPVPTPLPSRVPRSPGLAVSAAAPGFPAGPRARVGGDPGRRCADGLRRMLPDSPVAPRGDTASDRVDAAPPGVEAAAARAMDRWADGARGT